MLMYRTNLECCVCEYGSLSRVRDRQVDSSVTSYISTQFFHTHVAKMLYLAKRVKPECLAAVAFLSTRVTMSDEDDMNKLMRLLGYVLGTRQTGITFKIGDVMSVNVFIDAAYGVHSNS